MKKYIIVLFGIFVSFLLPIYSQNSSKNVTTSISNIESRTPNRALPFPVALPDGTALILKKNNFIGVVFLSNQRINPGKCDFEWYLRSDGKADFSPNASDVHIGICRNTDQLQFGPFYLTWSENSKGYGWVILSKDWYTGVILGTTRQEVWKRIYGTIMLKSFVGDKIILLPSKL